MHTNLPGQRSGMRTRPLYSGRQTSASGMPKGPGPVGTAANPSPAVPGVTTGLKRSPPTPNSGGIIDAGARGRRILPTDPNYRGPLATGFGAQAPNTPQAWRGAVRPTAAPGLDPGQEMAPANRPPQTERANPLANGGGPPQVEGTSRAVPAPTLQPGKAMGYSQRGNRTPPGDDLNQGQAAATPAAGPGTEETYDAATAPPGPQGDLAAAREGVQSDLQGGGHMGGIGQYARKFSNPTSASIYHDYTKRLFGGAATPKAKTNLTRTGPRDTGEQDFDYEAAA